VDERGFCFYTNHESRKGRELAANPRAALVFYWAEQERQVRVEGEVVFTSDAESDEYFHSRPVGSRIGAWASNQSDVIADRSVLEEAWHTYEKEYPNGDPPRPPHWGGYRLLPDLVEFWQGRSSRLHDRVRYRREGSDWLVERLAP
jgi:pyridoxamine 5'-phosphate oxidase